MNINNELKVQHLPSVRPLSYFNGKKRAEILTLRKQKKILEKRIKEITLKELKLRTVGGGVRIKNAQFLSLQQRQILNKNKESLGEHKCSQKRCYNLVTSQKKNGKWKTKCNVCLIRHNRYKTKQNK